MNALTAEELKARNKSEKSDHKYDDPGDGGFIIEEFDEENTGWVDARTFTDAGLCVFLTAPDGCIVMTPDQARKCAQHLNTVADRVEQARAILKGEK